MSNIITVVVTGASELLGSVIVDQLLDAGYTVRGTVRSGKAQRVKDAYVSFGDQFSVAIIDNLATADFTEAFKVPPPSLALALPRLSSRALSTAQSGSWTVHARQASRKSLRLPASSLSATRWIPRLERHLRRTTGTRRPSKRRCSRVIRRSSPMARQRSWQRKRSGTLQKSIPSWTSLQSSPPLYIDRLVADRSSTYPQTAPTRALINGPKGRSLEPQTMSLGYVHVTDAAAAHVVALKAPKSDRPKRIVNVGGYVTWNQAVEYLYEARPELRDRLPVIPEGYEASVEGWTRWDARSPRRMIGFRNFKDWKTTLNETIDDILATEKRLGAAQCVRGHCNTPWSSCPATRPAVIVSTR